jgi:hypothetical protein
MALIVKMSRHFVRYSFSFFLYYNDLVQCTHWRVEDYCSMWSYWKIHTHTHARARTIGRNPLDEGLACRRNLYPTTKNLTTDRFPFEPAVPASERPQSHALDRAVTGFDLSIIYRNNFNSYTKSQFWSLFYLHCGFSCARRGAKTFYLLLYVFCGNYTSSRTNITMQ